MEEIFICGELFFEGEVMGGEGWIGVVFCFDVEGGFGDVVVDLRGGEGVELLDEVNVFFVGDFVGDDVEFVF